MTEGKFLDAQDLVYLTGYTRRAEQIDALKEMAIRHTINPRGEIIVLWSWLEGKARDVEKSAINWDAVT